MHGVNEVHEVKVVHEVKEEKRKRGGLGFRV